MTRVVLLAWFFILSTGPFGDYLAIGPFQTEPSCLRVIRGLHPVWGWRVSSDCYDLPDARPCPECEFFGKVGLLVYNEEGK